MENNISKERERNPSETQRTFKPSEAKQFVEDTLNNLEIEGFTMNIDSTMKKLIYNVPNNQKEKISKLLKIIEENMTLQVEVEKTTLEDAFIKIVMKDRNMIYDEI